jgi:hypothetical protein
MGEGDAPEELGYPRNTSWSGWPASSWFLTEPPEKAGSARPVEPGLGGRVPYGRCWPS